MGAAPVRSDRDDSGEESRPLFVQRFLAQAFLKPRAEGLWVTSYDLRTGYEM
jgi:hypothetical protein